MISVFLYLLRLVLWCNMWSILGNIPCALEQNVYSSAVGWSVLCMSVRSSWFKVYFESNISFLTFCMVDLFIVTMGYKSPLLLLYCYLFLLSVVLILFCIFRCSDVRSTNIYSCIFLMNWLSFHYIAFHHWEWGYQRGVNPLSLVTAFNLKSHCLT